MTDIDVTNAKKHPKNNRRLRWRAILMAFAVLTMASIGTVYAWSMHEAEQVNNLQSHSAGVTIDEDFPGGKVEPGANRTKKVAFHNTSSSPVFIRVAYSETWESGSEWLMDDGSHAVKNWTTSWENDWWFDGQWYYYKKVLPAGGTTDNIITSVSFPAGLDAKYAGAQYSLNFMAETVQLSDEVDVNNQAVTALFGRTATLTITSTSNGKVTAGTVEWNY